MSDRAKGDRSEIVLRAARDRRSAAADRAAAAEGRAGAAADREQAVRDREQAARYRSQAQADRDALLCRLAIATSGVARVAAPPAA
jgi:hypothetical protein